MKNFKYFMVNLLVLICIQAACFIINAQKKKQIVGTADGKYGIITVNRPWQTGDTVNLRLSVLWVDENLEPIEDNSSVIILHKDNLEAGTATQHFRPGRVSPLTSHIPLSIYRAILCSVALFLRE